MVYVPFPCFIIILLSLQGYALRENPPMIYQLLSRHA